MAFVVRSEKKSSHIQINTSEQIGPGKYIVTQEKTNIKSLFPFNSSEIKDKKQKTLSPGPDTSNLEKNKLDDKLQLPGANEQIAYVEVPKVQSFFKSSTKRFEKIKSLHVPGPGSYEDYEKFPKIKQGMQQDEKQYNIVETIMKINKYKSIPSIPGKKQKYGYTENQSQELEINKISQYQYNGIGEDTVGPGEYQTKDIFEQNKNKGCDWSKYQPRIDEKRPQVPATGYYDIQNIVYPLYKMKQSPGFASNSLRHSDKRKGMISNEFRKQRNITVNESSSKLTNLETHDSESEYEYIEESTPGPGYYNCQLSAIKPQTKIEKFQFFGSSSGRFKEERTPSKLPPEEFKTIEKINSIKYRNPPFLSSNTRFEVRSNSEHKYPSPGQYDIKNTLQDKLINRIQKGYRGNFGTKETRFKYENSEEDLPGPGTYQKSIIRDEIESNPTSIFKSNAQRQLFKTPKGQKPGIGTYKLDYYDISNKIKTDEDEEDKDLKIKKPPFMSDEVRFNWQKIEKKQQIQNQLREIDEEEDSVMYKSNKNIYDLFSKKAKKGPPFDTNQKRFNYKVTKVPGPGDYKVPDENWNKRTYNILFADI